METETGSGGRGIGGGVCGHDAGDREWRDPHRSDQRGEDQRERDHGGEDRWERIGRDLVPRGRKSKMTMIERVKTVLEEELGIPADEIREDSVIMEDLGADSLDMIEIVCAFEEDLAIDISDEGAEKWVTVGDVVKYLEGVV